jgi:acetolactate synthase I/III small subunit
MKHTLSVLVENKPGVLTRVAGLFARRGFNIDSLVVGESEDPKLSRMTITIDGAEHPIDQVTKQLHKLINVVKIRDLDPEHTVARELALIKVNATSTTRSEIVQIAEIFQARVVDVDKRTLTIEMAASPGKLVALREMLQPFGVIEVVRTGTVAIARG